MDQPHNESLVDNSDARVDQVNQRILHHQTSMMGRVHSVQMQMENVRYHRHRHEFDLELGVDILKNEDTATEIDAQQRLAFDVAPPIAYEQRQELLLDTAVLFLYGRQIIPGYNQHIDKCIKKYNDLEDKIAKYNDAEPDQIGYEAVMNKLAELSDEVQERKRRKARQKRSTMIKNTLAKLGIHTSGV